jgi:hypothetical protein
VQLTWTYEFLGGHAGFYRAGPVKISVKPSNARDVNGVSIHLAERYTRSGRIAKELTKELAPAGDGFEIEFTWDSTVNNPEQELTVTLATASSDEPEMTLKDPIARRYNFLFSFSA